MKYYGVWDKLQNDWVCKQYPNYVFSKKPDSRIIGIPLWIKKEYVNKLAYLRNFDDSSGMHKKRFKSKEMTPPEALLRYCRKEM